MCLVFRVCSDPEIDTKHLEFGEEEEDDSEEEEEVAFHDESGATSPDV